MGNVGEKKNSNNQFWGNKLSTEEKDLYWQFLFLA